MDDFRRFFLRGLGALVPTLLTFAILVWVYGFINENIGVYITRGLLGFCSWISAEPAPGIVDEEKDPLIYGTPLDEWNEFGQRLTLEHKIIHHPALRRHDPAERETAVAARSEALWQIAFSKYRLHLLGFLIAIVLVYFTGFFLASFIGRTTWRATEGVLARVPLIRAIYPHVKQVTDFLLSERQVEFSGVVAVQFPRSGVWSLGLSTGGPIRRLHQEFPQKNLVTVFIPTSPTPFTGSVIQVPRDEVIDLNMTIDEGLRFMISGGVIKPEAEFPAPRLPAGRTSSE